jgi:hypothetical protein
MFPLPWREGIEGRGKEADQGSETRLYFGLTSAALLPRPGKRLAIALVDPHEGVAPCVTVPMERRLDRGTRHPGPVQEGQGGSHDRLLHLGIPRFPAWISQWKIGEHEAGNAALLDDVSRAAHDDSGNVVRL